jgi:predicted DNA binding CopG/RHH family protein
MKRDKVLRIRVSDKELEAIKNRYANVSAFIRSLITESLG